MIPKWVEIIGLNEEAMATWYKEFSTTPNQTWKATGQNCSWTTAHTLIAGMTDPKFASLKQEMLQVRLWIPQYVHQYAIKIKKLLE